MIQAITESTWQAWLSTEDNRIDTSVTSAHIRHLIKFTNDMDGSVAYTYPTETIKSRFTDMTFVYNLTPDMYLGQINLLPAGHWKYEVYEVSWIEPGAVSLGYAPATEVDVLPIQDWNGVVQGIVTKGILNLTEKTGTEQVQYTQYPENSETNYVYYGVDVAPPSPTGNFIFSVDTANAGSLSTQFQLPLISSGAISMDVDWGDGTTDTITSYNQAETLHTYGSSGIYTIEISNTVKGFYFNFGIDKLKILDISKWGGFRFTNIRTFTGCSNLTCSATDIPEIGTTDMTYTFGNCPLFNGSVSGWNLSNVTNIQFFFVNNPLFIGDGVDTWDVSSVQNARWIFGGNSAMNTDISGWITTSLTDIQGILWNATSFDQDLSSWDIDQVIDFTNFLTNGTLSTANYDALLIGWEAQAPQLNQAPNFGSSQYSLSTPAATARANLISTYGWTIIDGGGI